MTSPPAPSPSTSAASLATVAASGTTASLPEPTRDLVRRALAAGLVHIDDVKKVVVSLMAQDVALVPDSLAKGLVGSGSLTPWQSRKLLSGASRGFFLGNYRLLRPLGRGGMGVVYLGEHHIMKRRMALKILPPEASANPQRIERFKAEAEACAQLDHENIVRAYDFGQQDGKLFIVMEFVDGIDLGHAIARDGVMKPAAALDVLTQATAGLAHAHDRGIVHRDIKPSNLLLRGDGVVKLSDLGLARIGYGEASSGQKSRLIGTADYLAPEQAIDSQTVDSRADIYSLGCTLHYLLTGDPPYRGQTISQVLAQHQTAAVVDLRSRAPDCPPAVSELYARMTAKKPADRIRSATELVTHLQRLGGRSAANGGLTAIHHPATTDTIVDEGPLALTVRGSGGPGSSRVSAAAGSRGGGGIELDFSNLPAIDLGQTVPVRPLGSAMEPSAASSSPKPKAASGSKPSSDRGQSMMLGIGLTLACLALLVVALMVFHQMTKPLDSGPTRIRSIEEGGGGKMIVIQETR